MLNYFRAGPDLVSWHVTALGPQGTGPIRLTVHHAAGAIVEHFATLEAALARERELERLLVAARSGAPAASSGSAAVKMADPAAPTILVVDDDKAVTETFATVLHREGFNVRTATNAETGLREAAAHHTDAIILDLRMPLINGLGFLYRLRGYDEYRNTPVAIVTGSVVDDSTVEELNDLGAELRFKPLWLEDVVELAHHLVARPA